MQSLRDGAIQTAIYGGSLGDNVLNSASQFAINDATALGFNQIGAIKDKLNLNEGSAPGAFMHGFVGCLSFEASGGNCGAGFVTAATNEFVSPYYDNGFVADPNASHEQNKRAKQAYELDNAYRFGVVMGTLSSGGNPNNINIGSSVTTSAILNNRQLHDYDIADLANVLAKDNPEVLELMQNATLEELDATLFSREFYENPALTDEERRIIATTCALIRCDLHLSLDKYHKDRFFRDLLARTGGVIPPESKGLHK